MITSAIIIATNARNKDRLRESETKTPSHCTRLLTTVVISGALPRLNDKGRGVRRLLDAFFFIWMLLFLFVTDDSLCP